MEVPVSHSYMQTNFPAQRRPGTQARCQCITKKIPAGYHDSHQPLENNEEQCASTTRRGRTPPLTRSREGRAGLSSSVRRLFYKRDDLELVGTSQLLECIGDRPKFPLVQLRLVAEAQGRVPGPEFVRTLKEADHVTVLCISGHPVPGL